MRSGLAHALRRLARWSIKLSNWFDPIREALEADFAEYVGLDPIWESEAFDLPLGDDELSRPRTQLSVTYTGGPEGPAARKVRLREEC